MNIKKFVLPSVLIMFCCVITGCQKKKHKIINPENSVEIEISKSNESAIPPVHLNGIITQHWHQTNKRIAVVFGYDFNDDDITNSYLYVLQDQFGLDSDGGLVYPIIYPESFKHGTKSYVSDLREILKNDFKDKDLIGLIFLGAPENTHVVLEGLQDTNELNFPVFALFPQDDNFGMEATCDLIIEKSQKLSANDIPESNSSENELVALAPEVLLNSIKYLSILDEMSVSFSDKTEDGEKMEAIELPAFPKDKTMIQHVARILKGHTFKNFVDQDTGISSYNHFVIN